MTAIAERSLAGPVTTPAVTMAAALNRALADALSDDETVLVFGEDVGTLGGVFRVTDGLAARFGEARVFDTPLAESGIVGTAIAAVPPGPRELLGDESRSQASRTRCFQGTRQRGLDAFLP